MIIGLNIPSLICNIQKNLTPDLLKGKWSNKSGNNLTGHCYVATETFYWLHGKKMGFKPYVLSHKECPELLGEGETHWFLSKEHLVILDITKGQFNGKEIPYEKGKLNLMMNYPVGGSKRTQVLIKRLKI